MTSQLWRRMATGAAAGAAAYLGARAVSRVLLPERYGDRGTYLRSTTVNRTPGEVYSFWRDLPNLARALEHVVRVDEIEDRRSRWIVEGPGGSEIDFIVEILVDEPQRVIAWRAEDAPVPHEGQVRFTRAPGGRGTETRVGVTLLADVAAPLPDAGAVVASLAGRQPDELLRDMLRRVKQVLEAGEVIVADGRGRGGEPVRQRLAELVTHRVLAGGRA